MITMNAPMSLGLQKRIEDAGHWLFKRDDQWVASDSTAVQSIVDAYTVEDRRRDTKDRVDERAKELRDKATSRYSAAEMAGWAIKLLEAREHRNGGSVDILQREANARGVPVVDIVTRVESNAEQFMSLEAAIAGASGAHKDNIDALSDPWEIFRYDVDSGWPDV